MTATATVDDDEVTDIDEYRRNNPKFWKCRENHHRWRAKRGTADVEDDEGDDEDDEEEWIEAYNDPDATHHKVAQCARCKKVRRKRRRAVIRGQRMTSCITLPTKYDNSKCPGYGAKGVRITSAVVDETELRGIVEGALARKRGTRRKAAAR